MSHAAYSGDVSPSTDTSAPPLELVHGSVSLSRAFDVPPGVVFEAFSGLEHRSRWFRMPGGTSHDLDFRVGGSEVLTASPAVSGSLERIEYRSRFLDIAPHDRIVFSYESTVDGRPHATALVTVELERTAAGTTLRYTDQHVLYVYADGADRNTTVAHHEGAIRLLLNGLGAAVRPDRGRDLPDGG